MLYIQRGQLQHPGDVNVPSAVGAGGDQPEHVLCGPAARRCGNLVQPDGFGVGSVENYRELITPAARRIIAAKLVSVLSLRIGGRRYRIQPALNHRGIELVWRIADGMDTQWLPAQSTVHVLKIVQEALGNILRHTHATRVEVLLEPLHRQAGLLLEVRDNGHGITVPEGHATAAMGHGLVGMRRRAQLLGGTLQILGPPAVQGTCIRLVVTPQCLPERRRRARHSPR